MDNFYIFILAFILKVVSRTQIRIVGPLGAVEGDSRAEVDQQREETKAEELTEAVLQVELGAVEGDKFRKVRYY